MSDELINRRDLTFQLYEMLEVEKLTKMPRFTEHSKETFDATLETAKKLAEKYFAPHNQKNDEQEPTFDGKKVTIIPEVKIALDKFNQAGFLSSMHDYDLGGMQLPQTVNQACFFYFPAANAGTGAYSMLNIGAANLIHSFASEENKKRFLLPMLEGRFFGTMALTEPEAGSSLADITTSAKPVDDGSYKIKGNKIFISGGDHELSENIVHMVLAKIEGAPVGVKGISLFIVPKYTVDNDGALGKRNDVTLAGVIHKMGWKGTVSTMLNFGDEDDCVGYLVGEKHKGLSYMFQMMNEARISIGTGAVGIAYRAYLYSLEYAKGRKQGRHPSNRDNKSEQNHIIDYADIKSKLLYQKAIVEGSMALCMYSAWLIDQGKNLSDETERKNAFIELDFLTPIVKAWPSEKCQIAIDHALQILGGYGYTKEYPIEQYYRDNRLNPIHEGTNAIQAIDLLGRKLMLNEGAGLKIISSKIMDQVSQASAFEDLKEMCEILGKALQDSGEISMFLGGNMMQGKVDETLSEATLYFEVVSYVVIGWLWLKQATIASKALKDKLTEADKNFYLGKVQTAKFFITRELPKLDQKIALLKKMDGVCSSMGIDWF